MWHPKLHLDHLNEGVNWRSLLKALEMLQVHKSGLWMKKDCIETTKETARDQALEDSPSHIAVTHWCCSAGESSAYKRGSPKRMQNWKKNVKNYPERRGKAFSVHYCNYSKHYHALKENLFNQKSPSTLCRNERRSHWRTGEAFWMVPQGRDERNSHTQKHTLCYPAEKHTWVWKKDYDKFLKIKINLRKTQINVSTEVHSNSGKSGWQKLVPCFCRLNFILFSLCP